MAKQLTISNQEINKVLSLPKTEFPRYTGQLINLANQNAQGTRPRVVGQMSELIQKFKGQQFNEWASWYHTNYPNAINEATQKVITMIENLKSAIQLIDEKMVHDWVLDLVLIKTFAGFRFQEVILKNISLTMNLEYRLANSYEEARGIDGYIGTQPVSIKPKSYKTKDMLSENIEVPIIYYEKKKTGLSVDYSELH